MDAHDVVGQLAVGNGPVRPMRNSPHVDGRQDGLAQEPAAEQILEGADGLVVAHVLVDREGDAGR